MRTLILVKPTAVRRGLIGEVLRRFEVRCLKIAGLKILNVSREMAESLYSIHKGKEFYPGLIEYIISSPVVAVALETDELKPEELIEITRKMAGSTDPVKAEPGTFRGDFGLMIGRNVVHASDSIESAKRELPIFFKEEDFVS